MGIPEDLVSVMQKYSDDTREQIEAGMKKIGQDTVALLRATSPKRTGTYAQGWKAVTKTENGAVTLTVRQTGRNASLTHLLENGHRIYKHKNRRTRAFPHIAPAEEQAARAAEEMIAKVVGGA